MLWVFWWNKYEYSWIATAVSFIGTIFVTVGSFVLAAFLASLGQAYFENETVKTIGSGIGIVVAIAVFVTLKILLKKLTDGIEQKHLVVGYNMDKKAEDRKTAKEKAIINEGTNQRKIFKIIKNSVLDEELAIAGVRKLTDQSLIKGIIKYYDSGFPNRTKDSHVNRIIMEAVSRISDETTRDELKRHYATKM